MATINGTSRNDTLNGTSLADTIRGADGNDTISGKGGNDYLYGDSGGDTLYGDTGHDRIWGGTGIDALWGGDGDDQLYGTAGNDYMRGGIGNDYLHGGSDDDRLRGDDGNDTLNSGGGNDDLQGGAGNDTLINYARSSSGDPNDTARYDGGSGNDTLAFDVRGGYGDGAEAGLARVQMTGPGSGYLQYATTWEEPSGPYVGSFTGIENFKLLSGSNPLVFTGLGNVTVTGGPGDDIFEVGSGNQTLTGGAGADRFLFLWSPGNPGGHDMITDFRPAEGDMIGVGGYDDNYEQGWPVLRQSVVEHDGDTTITSTRPDTGEVVHVLDVVGVVGIDVPLTSYVSG